MLMICGDESDHEKSPEEVRSDPEGFAWFEEMNRRGVLRGGNRLRPSSDATTVHVCDDKVLLSDGPFAESREQMGGYDLIECEDLDEAIEFDPVASSGTIEVRPLRET